MTFRWGAGWWAPRPRASRRCWYPTSVRIRATSKPILKRVRSWPCRSIYKGKVIGVLDLEHTRRGFFTEEHQRTMTTLAAQIAIAIENARLYEEIERQERRLERDLALARELQGRLLPQTSPKLAHLDVAAKFVPARAIGGDLYDFIPYSMSRLGIVIGDVSGKGAPAAIYAALVSGIIRSHAPIEPGSAEMLSAVNLSLAERRIEAQFVSIIYAVWDDEHRTLTVANSGLPRPIFVHGGKNEVIEATGLPLGLFDEAEYDEFKFRMKPGDMFVFFSDGILDARNRKGEMFGRGRGREDRCRMRRQVGEVRGGFALQGRSRTLGGRRSVRRPDRRRHPRAWRCAYSPQKEMTPRSQSPAARAPGFVYVETGPRETKLRKRQLALYCEDVSLTKLAERYGTPLYVYSAAMIRERYRAFDAAFRGMPHTICYSVKANSNLSILRLLAREGLRIRRGFRRRTGARAGRGPQGRKESRVLRCGQDARRTHRGAESRHHAFQRRERVGIMGCWRSVPDVCARRRR